MAMNNIVLSERIAQIAAHRACCGTEHNPAEGKLHGYCVVCGVPWPCDYAGKPPAFGSSAIRNMLHAMQNGELTVSCGVELVDMWLAGNYRDDMLPPVREGLGEDEMPWDRIDSLTKQRDDLQMRYDAAHSELARMTDQLGECRNVANDLRQQRDDLLESFEVLRDRVKDEFDRLYIAGVIAKVKK